MLGIYRRDGSYLGVPARPTKVEPGDRLIVYGEDDVVSGLAARPAGPEGDRAHADAVARYRGERAQTADV